MGSNFIADLKKDQFYLSKNVVYKQDCGNLSEIYSQEYKYLYSYNTFPTPLISGTYS